jgi:hypothetical protein
MTSVARRFLLAVGLVLLVGGIADLVLPALPGWALILLALPCLAIATILRFTPAAQSRVGQGNRPPPRALPRNLTDAGMSVGVNDEDDRLNRFDGYVEVDQGHRRRRLKALSLLPDELVTLTINFSLPR